MATELTPPEAWSIGQRHADHNGLNSGPPGGVGGHMAMKSLHGPGGQWNAGGQLEPGFAAELQRMLSHSPYAFQVVSGYRSLAEQGQLWKQAAAQHGEDGAASLLAPPGTSWHEKGLAVDLRYAHAGALRWVHDNAAHFGLVVPNPAEPWHLQPAWTMAHAQDGTGLPAGAPVGSPDGLGAMMLGVQSMFGAHPDSMAAVHGPVDAGNQPPEWMPRTLEGPS